MAADGKSLLSNDSSGAPGPWVYWRGGKTSLVIFGTLPTTTKLQFLGKDGATPVDVATITAAGMTSYDLPAGKYRISQAGGVPAGVYADLASSSWGV